MSTSLRVSYTYAVTDTDAVSGSKYTHNYQNGPTKQINISVSSVTESAVRSAITNNFPTPSGATLELKGVRNLDLMEGSSTPQHGGPVYS